MSNLLEKISDSCDFPIKIEPHKYHKTQKQNVFDLFFIDFLSLKFTNNRRNLNKILNWIFFDGIEKFVDDDCEMKQAVFLSWQVSDWILV